MDRLVEQPKNRLRKSYTYQNLTISAQCEVRSISPATQAPPAPRGGLEDFEGGRTKTAIILNSRTLFDPNYDVGRVFVMLAIAAPEGAH